MVGAEVARTEAVPPLTVGINFFFNQRARAGFPVGLLILKALLLLHTLVFVYSPSATL